MNELKGRLKDALIRAKKEKKEIVRLRENSQER